MRRALRRLSSLRLRMLLDPHYWRKGLRLVERALRRDKMHWESLVDSCIQIVQSPISVGRLAEPAVSMNAAVTPALGVDLGTLGRVLYVAPRFDYDDPSRGLSFEENNFFHTLAHAVPEVIRFDSLGIARLHGREAMNELLLEVAYRYQPQVVFFVLFNEEFSVSTLNELTASPGLLSVNWFTDDHWRFDNFSRHWAPAFDWVVTTDPESVPKYHAAGIGNVICSQWAFNPRLHYRMGLEKRYDVVFVGQPYGQRRGIIARLKTAGIDVRTWGYGWPGGKLSQRKMVRVFNQARIALNLSGATRGGREQIKGRVFEITGTGTLLLTQGAAHLDRYFRLGEEIICFHDEDELLEEVRYYLAQSVEREAIADRGYRRSLAEHTWELRFAEIFRQMGILPNGSPATA